MNDEPEDNNENQDEAEASAEAGAEQTATEGEAQAGAASDQSAGNVDLEEFSGDSDEKADGDEDEIQKTAQDLEAVYDVPISISAVLGRTHMEVSELLRLESGDVIELDRKVGEAIDIYVNNRLIARGEVVLVDEKLGITMTEIIKTERH